MNTELILEYINIYTALVKNFIIENPITIIIFGYLLWLIILHQINLKIINWQKSVAKRFVYEIDNILYLQALALQENKNDIFNYKDNLDILLNTKRELLNAKEKSYFLYSTKLIEDIKYLEQLLWKQIITEENISWIENSKSFLWRARKLSQAISTILGIITLGVYFFIAPKPQW